MKKIVLSMLALVFTFAVTSCRDTEKKDKNTMEDSIEAVEDTAKNTQDAAEEAADDVEQTMENAADNVKESAAKAQLKSE